MGKILSWEEIYKKLNIKRMISRYESAESSSIPFSKFDICYISGMEFNNGEVNENIVYRRNFSNFFQKSFEILKKWNYEIDNEYYNSKRIFLNNDYKFINTDLPHFKVNVNTCHEHLFRVCIGYENDSDWVETKDVEKIINKTIIDYIKKSGNIKLLRELKLRQLINEI